MLNGYNYLCTELGMCHATILFSLTNYLSPEVTNIRNTSLQTNFFFIVLK